MFTFSLREGSCETTNKEIQKLAMRVKVRLQNPKLNNRFCEEKQFMPDVLSKMAILHKYGETKVSPQVVQSEHYPTVLFYHV